MDLGAFRTGVDMGPLAIRHARLIPKIRDAGYDVIDYGDIVPLVAEDEGNSHMRYEKEINESNRRLYDCIISNYRDKRMPIILGGIIVLRWGRFLLA